METCTAHGSGTNNFICAIALMLGSVILLETTVIQHPSYTQLVQCLLRLWVYNNLYIYMGYFTFTIRDLQLLVFFLQMTKCGEQCPGFGIEASGFQPWSSRLSLTL